MEAVSCDLNLAHEGGIYRHRRWAAPLIPQPCCLRRDAECAHGQCPEGYSRDATYDNRGRRATVTGDD